MTVTFRLPSALSALAGGRWTLCVAVPDSPEADLASALDALAETHPALERRLRDETGTLRGFVNVYVDTADVRPEPLLAARIRHGSVIDIVPSVAGG